MSDRGKIDGPIFKTFDTASLDQKKTKHIPDPSLIERAYEFFVSRSRSMIIGEVSLRFDLRLDMTLAILDSLCESGRIRRLTVQEKSIEGYHPIADVYRLVEK